MAFIEGYPEFNIYTMDEYAETEHGGDTKDQEKEQRSLFALETQLQKTKLCRYHMKGLCKHGTGCRFAHGAPELVQPPNLQKTRMCPNTVSGLQCNNSNCTFAHHESELKKVNICHKTAVCTWFLAGKCRNGVECHFAHGVEELKGNASNGNGTNMPAFTGNTTNTRMQQNIPEQKPQQQMLYHHQQFVPTTLDNSGYKQQEPMFIQPSISARIPMPPPYCPAQGAQFHEQAYQFQPTMPLPVPPPPPFDFMPTYAHGMQPRLGLCPPPPPQEVQAMMPANFMPMQPPQMMQQFADVVEIGSPVRSLPPGLPVSAGVVPTSAPGVPVPGSEKSWQLTELAVQMNMLSEEVKRLQGMVPASSVMQSTNSGSSTRSSSDDSANRQPDANDRRSFEEKVVHLQNELKRVMDEGQRCGKIRQTVL